MEISGKMISTSLDIFLEMEVKEVEDAVAACLYFLGGVRKFIKKSRAVQSIRCFGEKQ